MYTEKQLHNFYESLKKIELLDDNLSNLFDDLFPKPSNDINGKILNNGVGISLDKLRDILAKGRGRGGAMNVYPSDGDIGCMRLCVGIASLGWTKPRSGNRIGFLKLMEELLIYWLSCNNANKTTVIFTADWFDSGFNDKWKDKVDAYVSSSKKVVIIWLSSNGPVLNYPVN